jgi:hypothetical protein
MADEITPAKATEATNKALHSNPIVDLIRTLGHTNAVPVAGYLHQGDKDKDSRRWKLYRTLEFDDNDCIEFTYDRTEVLFVYQRPQSDQDPDAPAILEPAIVWFNPEARIQMSFLVGTIASFYMPRADGGALIGQRTLEILAATSVGGGCSTKITCGCGQ